MTIRCFIAIEIEEAIRDEFARVQQQLQKELRGNESGIKWVPPENIHLTLKFLGNVTDQEIPEICAAVSRAASESSPFSFSVGSCGSFPPNRPARVLWIGITEGQPELKQFAKRVDHWVNKLGFPLEKRAFSGHLTLARIRQPNAGKAVSRVATEITIGTLGQQDLSEITVFQSDLRPGGPVYTPLHHAPLTDE
jgi:RNA 2',3'-cyclic 3'-phosphodiesterase